VVVELVGCQCTGGGSWTGLLSQVGWLDWLVVSSHIGGVLVWLQLEVVGLVGYGVCTGWLSTVGGGWTGCLLEVVEVVDCLKIILEKRNEHLQVRHWKKL